jgi:hypothetical protein
MVDCDFERYEELTKALHASGRLTGYSERYSSEDVILLVADARAMFDQTGDVINPRSAELVVRAPLGEYEEAAHVPDEEVVQAQVVVCSYLAAENLLGDPDVFMGEVQELLDEWAADDQAGEPGVATQGDKT